MRRRWKIAVLVLAAIPLSVFGQQAESVPIQFLSGGDQVHGQFFSSVGGKPIATLLLIPGWPGDPRDVLGLGALLAELDINVAMFNPRGMHASEGTNSFANTLEDIAAALEWLRRPEIREQFAIDAGRMALGGHSYGGGMAMAYEAADSSFRRVISIAGTDLGVLVRRMHAHPQFSEAMRRMLAGTRAPEGPVRFDLDATFQELTDHQDTYGLQESASRLADRSILLMGAWDDLSVTVEDMLLPLYRELKGAGASDVTFLTYHDGHNFVAVREDLARDIQDWLQRHPPQ